MGLGRARHHDAEAGGEVIRREGPGAHPASLSRVLLRAGFSLKKTSGVRERPRGRVRH